MSRQPSCKIAFVTFIAAVVATSAVLADDFDICRNDSGDVAIAACSRVIASGRATPHDLAIAYVDRGLEYKMKGQFDRAIADATEGIRADPGSSMAIANRGSFYYEKGDFDRAVTDATAAIRLDPANIMAFSNRAAAYTRKGNYDLAIADSSEAIRLNPANAQSSFTNRATAHAAKGNFDLAIADATDAIRLDPKLAQAWYIRGFAKRKKGDKSGGDSDMGKANSLQPGIAN